MSKLQAEKNQMVVEEIKNILKKRNKDIIDEVKEKYPDVTLNQISGILSEMNRKGIVHCSDGYCY